MQSTEAMKTRLAALTAGAEMRVSDDTMRWLFGTPDPALTPEQQFQTDFIAEEPNASANKKRRAFCTAHGLSAKQDRGTGYWSFAESHSTKSR